MAEQPRKTVQSPGGTDALDDLILLERRSRSLPPVEAVPDEGAIARWTAKVLAEVHYLQQPLNDEISSKFLDRYLATLDNLHLHFLRSDLEEFDQYRTVLDDLTIAGKTGPAREIFKRFLQRVDQRVAYVAELLKTEQFEFTGNDRFYIDRRKAPYPKDLDEAKRLWRLHLRYEYLQEKLNLERPKVADSTRPGTSRPPSVFRGSASPADTRNAGAGARVVWLRRGPSDKAPCGGRYRSGRCP